MHLGTLDLYTMSCVFEISHYTGALHKYFQHIVMFA